jgi:hypothetical protein
MLVGMFYELMNAKHAMLCEVTNAKHAWVSIEKIWMGQMADWKRSSFVLTAFISFGRFYIHLW